MQHTSHQIDNPMFFSEILGEKCASDTLPEIETPLGTFAFFFELNSKNVTAKPSSCFNLSYEERLFRYELEEATFEFFIFPRLTDFTLIPYFQVESCLMCALRLTSSLDNLQLRFTGAWSKDNYPNGGVESGERLMAMSWKGSNYIVSLGTGDVEWHHPRAGKSFPLRWKQFLPQYESPSYINEKSIPLVEPVDEKGLIFEPPDLMGGESCQLAFSIAWADLNFSSENDSSTWFAVDLGKGIERDDFLPLQPENTNI